MSRNRTIKDRHATVNKGRYLSIAENLEKEMEWKLWPSSCIAGEVFVIVRGKPMPYDKFIDKHPNPNVEKYSTDLTNVDTQNI